MGKSEQLPDRLSLGIEAEFPNLSKSGYYVTSHATRQYNCIAYAAGDETRKWDSSIYYWPPGAMRGGTIAALVSAFGAIGYEICAGDHLESGYEKVALYVDSRGGWTHAAKQLEDGAWSSKLGDSYDIRHSTPHALHSNIYGQVMYYMRRKLKNAQAIDEQLERISSVNKPTEEHIIQ